jgi:hypothetical protein
LATDDDFWEMVAMTSKSAFAWGEGTC